VAEDEVVGEIETDKVSAKFKLHLKYNPKLSAMGSLSWRTVPIFTHLCMFFFHLFYFCY